MLVIICNDEPSQDNALSVEFMKSLIDTIDFDGRDDEGGPILDPVLSAARLHELIHRVNADGLVLDLHWWGKPGQLEFDHAVRFGESLLFELQTGYRLPDGFKTVIFSRFISRDNFDHIEDLHVLLNLPRECIVDKHLKRPAAVVSLFQPI